VITDNAMLNIRTGDNHRELTAVVIDHDLDLLDRPDLAIRYMRTDSRLFLVTDLTYSGPLHAEGIDIITTPFLNRRVDLHLLLQRLYKDYTIYRLLIESGPLFSKSLLAQNLVDEYHLYTASHSIPPNKGLLGIERSLLKNSTKIHEVDLGGDLYEAFDFRWYDRESSCK
jgi:riboflavin biosynthesis pyrimidine reductase